jgi:hypothetical protein
VTTRMTVSEDVPPPSENGSHLAAALGRSEGMTHFCELPGLYVWGHIRDAVANAPGGGGSTMTTTSCPYSIFEKGRAP